MFYITISNGLLKDGHRKRMGAAVWEFMWCIDKVTRVDEDGTGWVLGGKPINLKDLAEQMGMGEGTVSENLEKLSQEGYITKTRTPYGIVIKVNHTKKTFRKTPILNSEKPKSPSENPQSNKTVSVDSTEDRVLPKSKTRPLQEDEEESVVSVDEDGNELVRKKSVRNAAADRVANYFNKKAREYSGKDTIMGYAYSIVKNLIENKRYTEEFLTKVVDDFFEASPPDNKAVNPYMCFSARNINNALLE